VSSNSSSGHSAVPLELRNSSEVNSHSRILSYPLGTDHEQKTQPLYCCMEQTTQKTLSSTVVWRHRACVNMFTETLPGNASQYLWVGWDLCPLGTSATIWPTVPAQDDRWWWLWSLRWNENWQGKPKYSEKTCHSSILSTTNPTWRDLGSNPGCCGGDPKLWHCLNRNLVTILTEL
jgi:hypothetical protein